MNLENLLYGLRLTVVAMGVVFVALYALSLMMYALPALAGQRRQPKGQAATSPVVEATPVAEDLAAEQAAASQSSGMSPEIVAVIATALAAYLGQAPENLNIISIRRTPMQVSPWSLTARRESAQN